MNEFIELINAMRKAIQNFETRDAKEHCNML